MGGETANIPVQIMQNNKYSLLGRAMFNVALGRIKESRRRQTKADFNMLVCHHQDVHMYFIPHFHYEDLLQ